MPPNAQSNDFLQLRLETPGQQLHQGAARLTRYVSAHPLHNRFSSTVTPELRSSFHGQPNFRVVGTCETVILYALCLVQPGLIKPLLGLPTTAGHR